MADHGAEPSVPERWNALGPDSNMWMNWADDPRNSGTEPVGERATLLDYLRAYRLVLEMKCADLDAEQLARRSVPPSTMSLLGLVRHMADVERNWFRRVMAGQDAPPYYWSDEVADADWAGAVADPAVVADAWQSWRDEVAFAEQYVADSGDLGVRGTMRDGSSVALREVIVHMIEEYARHAGHADLLRERIDGRVGQLSPGGMTPVTLDVRANGPDREERAILSGPFPRTGAARILSSRARDRIRAARAGQNRADPLGAGRGRADKSCGEGRPRKQELRGSTPARA